MTWIERKKSWGAHQQQSKPAAPVDLSSISDAVSYIPVRCPVCGSKRCPVITSRLPIRYHRCECGHTFKSVEDL